MPLTKQQLKQFYSDLGARLSRERQKLADVDGIALKINEEAAKQPFIRKAVEERFDREGGPNGKWKPLAKSTLKQRKRLGFGFGPILQRTGALKAAAVNGTPVATSTSINISLTGKAAKYGYALNAVRPFLVPLKGKERKDLDKFTKKCVDAYVAAVANGN